MVPRPLVSHPTSLASLAGSGLLAVLTTFAGCASVQNTPQQDYVWEMGRTCDARTNIWYMDTVESNGSYTIRGATNSVGSSNLPYFECMKEQFTAHPYSEWLRARQGGAQPPLAVADQPDSIPLGTTDPKYQEYFSHVHQQITSKWIYPQDASSKGVVGEVSVDFGIEKSGELKYIERKNGSGEAILDDSVIRAIQLASPFPPVPDSVSKGGVRIHGVFRYRITSDKDSGK
jgi:TonB family protein